MAHLFLYSLLLFSLSSTKSVALIRRQLVFRRIIIPLTMAVFKWFIHSLLIHNRFYSPFIYRNSMIKSPKVIWRQPFSRHDNLQAISGLSSWLSWQSHSRQLHHHFIPQVLSLPFFCFSLRLFLLFALHHRLHHHRHVVRSCLHHVGEQVGSRLSPQMEASHTSWLWLWTWSWSSRY